MEKKYLLELDGKNIGYTKFEYADVPMGVIHGKVIFEEIDSPYNFFKEHCLKFKVELNSDIPEDRLIATRIIPQLKVFLENEYQLEGLGGTVTVMEPDDYEIEFYGITSELMQTEFKHHFDNYYSKSNPTGF